MATETWTAAAQTGDSTAGNDDANAWHSFRVCVNAATASASGTQVRLKFYAYEWADLVIDELTIGPRSGSTSSFASAPTKLKIGGADISPTNKLTIPANSSGYTDWIDFNFDEGTNYLVAFWVDAGLKDKIWSAASGVHCYWDTYDTAGNTTATNMPSSYTDASLYVHLCALGSIEVQSPSVTLTAEGGLQEQAGDSPALAQTHILVTQEGAQGQIGASAALSFIPDIGAYEYIAATDLVAAECVQDQASDEPALTGTHILAAAEGAQAEASDAPVLTGTHVIAAEEGLQAQSGDSPALTQTHALAAAEATQGQGSDSPTLTQVHNLEVAEGMQGQASDNAELGSISIDLVAEEGVQSQLSDSPSLSQVHILSADEGNQAQTSDVPNVQPILILEAQDGTQGQLSDAPNLSQVHALVTAGGVQVAISDEARIDRIIILMAEGGAQGQLSDNAQLDFAIWLALQEGRQGQTSAQVNLKAGGIPPDSWGSRRGKHPVSRTKRVKPGMKGRRWFSRD